MTIFDEFPSGGFRITARRRERVIRCTLTRVLEIMQPHCTPAEANVLSMYCNGRTAPEIEAVTGRKAATIYKQVQRVTEQAVRQLLGRRWEEEEIGQHMQMTPDQVHRIVLRLRKLNHHEISPLSPEPDDLSGFSKVV